MGYIDPKGKIVIRIKYPLQVRDFSEGLARVCTMERTWGYIDKGGEYAIPPRYSEAQDFREGLAAVKTGDVVVLDVPSRRLDVRLSDGEIRARLEDWVAPKGKYRRGYRYLFEQHVQQASEGCDFDCA